MLPRDYNEKFFVLMSMFGGFSEIDSFVEKEKKKLDRISKFSNPKKSKEISKKLEKFIDDFDKLKESITNLDQDEIESLISSCKSEDSKAVLSYFLFKYNKLISYSKKLEK